MSEQRRFVVTATMTAHGGRVTLLAMASVLHRRGVEVVEADIGRPARSVRVFTVRRSPLIHGGPTRCLGRSRTSLISWT